MVSMKIYVAFLLSFFALGCMTPVRLPKDISIENKVLLPFRVDTVFIVDLRSDTTSEQLKLPLLSIEPREWIVRPALKTNLRQEIVQLINRASFADGIPAEVTLYVQDGYYKIAGNAHAVGEYAVFDCLINFAPKESNVQWNASSKSYNNNERLINATEKHAKEMYRITAINGVYAALKQGKKIFDEEGE